MVSADLGPAFGIEQTRLVANTAGSYPTANSSYLMVTPVTSPTETLPGYYTGLTTDADGYVTVQPWAPNNAVGGTRFFDVTVGGQTIRVNYTTPAAAPAGTITFVSGNGQSIEACRPFAQTFTAEVRDAGGQLMANTPVTFAINGGGGTLQYYRSGNGPGASTTNVVLPTGTDGRAYVTVLAGNTPGVTTLTATVDGLTATANATLTASTTNILTQVSPTGNIQPLSGQTDGPFVVHVSLPNGSPAVGATVNYSLAGLGSLSAMSVVTDANGDASVMFTAPTNMGGTSQTQHTITATSPGAFGTATYSAIYTLAAPHASSYLISGDNQTVARNLVTALPLVAGFRDPYGNPLSIWVATPVTRVSVTSGAALINGLPGPVDLTTNSTYSNQIRCFVSPTVAGPTTIRMTFLGTSYPPVDFTVNGL
jgi:hypothetical protein